MTKALSRFLKFRLDFLFSLIIIMVSLNGTNILQAQQLPYLNTFSATETNGRVYLHWIIASGNTCDGVRVYRSADGVNYEQIGKIAGICGSPYSAVSYEFWDTLPLLNRKSYYRLELGNLGFSLVEELIVYDFSNQKYQLIPHPFRNGGSIAFENPAFETWKLQLYNLNGKLVWEEEQNENTFQLPAGKLKSGMYSFQIYSLESKEVISGKLVVVE